MFGKHIPWAWAPQSHSPSAQMRFLQQNKLGESSTAGVAVALLTRRVQLACASIPPSPCSSILLWKEAGIQACSALFVRDLKWVSPDRGRFTKAWHWNWILPSWRVTSSSLVFWISSSDNPFILKLTNEGQNKVPYGQAGEWVWKQRTTLKGIWSH